MTSVLKSIRSSDLLFSLVRKRRTTHKLGRERTLQKDTITGILRNALLVTPSSFNSQTTRMILMLDDDNRKLWDIAERCLEDVCGDNGVPPDTKDKLEDFRGANGTVLFYEDREAVSALRSNPKFTTFAQYFNSWSDQTNAMHKYLVWSALCTEGLGATLQHYNPLIDQKVADEWQINRDWELLGQLVFGKPAGPIKEKSFLPMENRLIIHDEKQEKSG
ncbi:uncharacterized protein TRUGW13939_11837 [Talaromyces rugulosus]|uniref:Nitroreductase domain-containing protein n=1 Tax=Talaromyces rugulosus TaxID=121627 RepID=A0A7H8RFZ0_TALRU|nr:uncharacterized protein TRUGW13939_11837 [Talaromyces rugulosus]QKX64661.1 hypothetical protein TRUGW13939_11837 [Talaromyces rugulosus]